MTEKCAGCGVILQTSDTNKEGYVDNIEKEICNRKPITSKTKHAIEIIFIILITFPPHKAYNQFRDLFVLISP